MRRESLHHILSISHRSSCFVILHDNRWNWKNWLKKKKRLKLFYMIKCAMQSTNSFVKNIIFFVKTFIKKILIKTFIRLSRLSSKEFSSNFELNSVFSSVKIFIFFDYKFCLRRASFLLNNQEMIIKSKEVICDEIDFIILNKKKI